MISSLSRAVSLDLMPGLSLPASLAVEERVVFGKGESGDAAHSIKNALTALILPPDFFRRGVEKRISGSMLYGKGTELLESMYCASIGLKN
jgi:hypothetical protein